MGAKRSNADPRREPKGCERRRASIAGVDVAMDRGSALNLLMVPHFQRPPAGSRPAQSQCKRQRLTT